MFWLPTFLDCDPIGNGAYATVVIALVFAGVGNLLGSTNPPPRRGRIVDSRRRVHLLHGRHDATGGGGTEGDRGGRRLNEERPNEVVDAVGVV